MIEVTKIFTFDAAHELDDYEGACARLHGHTYKLEVTVTGALNEQGMVCDFKKLKELVDQYIIDKMDHRYLNELFPFNTTAEQMASWIFTVLSKQLNRYLGVTVKQIRLWETPTSYAAVTD